MKNTKRALLASVLSLLLCASMLVGSTFAWFTDTDTVAVSNIVSGTLDIEIVDENGAEKTDAFSFKNNEGSADILWEPGVTFRTEGFRLKNVGNLYLKAKLSINNTEVSYNKLNEVITYKLVNAAGNEVKMDEIYLAPAGREIEGLGYPNMSEDLIYIEAHMDENAGNVYKNLTLSGVSITVVATQMEAEFDSFEDDYDASAEMPIVVTAQDELNNAVKDADKPATITLPSGTYSIPKMSNKDLTFTGTKDTVIDMPKAVTTADSNVAFEGVTVKFDDKANYNGFQHSKKVVYRDCKIIGQQTIYALDAEFINCEFENYDAYNVWTYGANKVTFTDCTFTTGGRAILVYNEVTDGNFVADITLNNCKFSDNGTYVDPKAAVETGSNANNTATSNKYNLTFNQCVIEEGFEQNNSTSNLWGNKNNMDKDHLNVVIDGEDVY